VGNCILDAECKWVTGETHLQILLRLNVLQVSKGNKGKTGGSKQKGEQANSEIQ
jgi:hypothetical protein